VNTDVQLFEHKYIIIILIFSGFLHSRNEG